MLEFSREKLENRVRFLLMGINSFLIYNKYCFFEIVHEK